MKIFLTGGTGFIGKFVVQKLDNPKNKLLILSRNPNDRSYKENITFIKSDLGKIDSWKDILKKFKPEAAIHLAWEGIPDYGVENSIKNLNHGLNLTRVLSEIGCQKMLVAGSLWEYGDVKGKISENHPINPFNAFTAAKNSLHWLGREIAKERNMIFLWTRIFYVFGPGQKPTSLISYLIKCVQKKVIPEIRNPNAQNDFVYVEDVAEAIYRLLLNCKKSDVFNIGSGRLTSIQDITKKIFSLSGAKPLYRISKREQMDSLTFYYANISKIRKEVGWKPQVSIKKGLTKTIDSIL